MQDEAQMLCLGCGRVGVPDTWVPGSERVELAAWCCLAFPGLAYCAWRHAYRSRHCPDCGSDALIREPRVSGRSAVAPSERARAQSAGGSAWPLPLDAPRERLRQGAALALFGLLASLAALATALGGLPAAGAIAIAPALAQLGLSALLLQIALLQRSPDDREPGRPRRPGSADPAVEMVAHTFWRPAGPGPRRAATAPRPPSRRRSRRAANACSP